MSEQITREEFAARLEAVESRLDARFERADARAEARFAQIAGEVRTSYGELRTSYEELRGDIREVKAASVGKTTFALGLVALFSAIVAVLAWGGDRFGAGVSVSDIARSAAREVVAEAARRP